MSSTQAVGLVARRIPQADQVTLAMLMNGTSGYADYVTDDGFIEAASCRPVPALDAGGADRHRARARPMVCEPGACWSYAHTNFVILGKVLEKIAGAAARRADPRGHARAAGARGNPERGDGGDLGAGARTPSTPSAAATRSSTYWDPSWTLAEGSIMTSNVADILTSAAAIGEGRLVSPESHALQFAPDTAKFPPWDERTSTTGWASSASTAGWCRTRPSPAMRRRWPICRRASSRSWSRPRCSPRRRWREISRPMCLRRSPPGA